MLSLCLSRACLGKIIGFIYVAQKTLRPFAVSQFPPELSRSRSKTMFFTKTFSGQRTQPQHVRENECSKRRVFKIAILFHEQRTHKGEPAGAATLEGLVAERRASTDSQRRRRSRAVAASRNGRRRNGWRRNGWRKPTRAGRLYLPVCEPGCFEPFIYIIAIFLPRQARDKHIHYGKHSKKTSSFSLRRIEDYAGTHLMLPVYSAHDRDRCGKIVVVSAMQFLANHALKSDLCQFTKTGSGQT